MKILVMGGSGFLGREVCARLITAGHTVVVPTRKRDNARDIALLPALTVLEADVHDAAVLRQLVAGQDAVINLVGILNERRRGDFERVHVTLTQNLIAACKSAGVRRYLQVSALGANESGPSEYLKSKARSEALVKASGLDYTLIAPSVIFGVGDSFLNRFAHMAGLMPPMLPLALPGANAKFQPVWVNDVARTFEQALLGRERESTYGQRYELVGPKVYTLRELVRYTLNLAGDSRAIVGLPGWAGSLLATVLQCLPAKPLTRDNLKSMQVDNVSSAAFPAFAGRLTALEDIAPQYLGQVALQDRFMDIRKA